MKSGEIWVSIIIPILIGPIFVYFKLLYDNYSKNKKDHQLLVYNNNVERLTKLLNSFYWPLYIKLLCIQQLNYYIPIKNSYEYVSDSDNDGTDNDGSNNNITSDTNSDVRINIFNDNDIILDSETLKLMCENLNKMYDDTRNIIENNIYFINETDDMIDNLIVFIKYCKIRLIINDGSVHKKYNIGYFGIENNIEYLTEIIKQKTIRYQEEYNESIKKGPFIS